MNFLTYLICCQKHSEINLYIKVTKRIWNEVRIWRNILTDEVLQIILQLCERESTNINKMIDGLVQFFKQQNIHVGCRKNVFLHWRSSFTVGIMFGNKTMRKASILSRPWKCIKRTTESKFLTQIFKIFILSWHSLSLSLPLFLCVFLNFLALKKSLHSI